MTFSDGGSMTILVTQYKCHYYAFVMKTHIFSDDNGSSRIVKSLVVIGKLVRRVGDSSCRV